jgi:hypothetical protein
VFSRDDVCLLTTIHSEGAIPLVSARLTNPARDRLWIVGDLGMRTFAIVADGEAFARATISLGAGNDVLLDLGRATNAAVLEALVALDPLARYNLAVTIGDAASETR